MKKTNKEDYDSLLEMQSRLLAKFKEQCKRKPDFTMADITALLSNKNRVRNCLGVSNCLFNMNNR